METTGGITTETQHPENPEFRPMEDLCNRIDGGTSLTLREKKASGNDYFCATLANFLSSYGFSDLTLKVHLENPAKLPPIQVSKWQDLLLVFITWTCINKAQVPLTFRQT